MRGYLERLVGLVAFSAGEGGGAPAPQGEGEGVVVVVPRGQPLPDTQAAIGAALGAQGARAADQGGQAAPPSGALTPAQLTAFREQAVRLNPNVIPELITGGTIEEVTASLGTAAAAFERVANGVRAQVAGSLPAGGGTREVDTSAYEGLSPEGKIQFALGNRQG